MALVCESDLTCTMHGSSHFPPHISKQGTLAEVSGKNEGRMVRGVSRPCAE